MDIRFCSWDPIAVSIGTSSGGTTISSATLPTMPSQLPGLFFFASNIALTPGK